VNESNYDGEGDPSSYDIDTPANIWSLQPDPRGGVVVDGQGLGGAFNIAPDGSSSRIVDGSVLALSVNTAVAIVCKDDLDSCQLLVRDRSIGADSDRLLPIDSDGATVLQPLYNSWGTPVPAISPTEDRMGALRINSNYETVFGILSLVDGSFTEIARQFSGGGAAWSADGRYLFFVDGASDLKAFDTTLAVVFEVAPELNQTVAAFAVRT
jgi:hypothetical protein